MAIDPGGFSSPKRILEARHLRPRKRFGQNFLLDPKVADRIARALPPQSHVVEIGGGTGALTAALLQHARSVTTLEIDRDLWLVLQERFASEGSRLQVLSSDVLDFDLQSELRSHAAPRAVCGNLPYYITTPIIERLFEASGWWDCAVLMVQHEYARRLAARPGSSHYGSLSVYAAYFANVEKLFDVGAAGFYPAPDVASSVVRLTPRTERARLVSNENSLLWLIRAAFAHRRKTFVNSVLAATQRGNATLRKELESALQSRGLTTNVRGERLSLADFCALADHIDQQHLVLY